MFANTTLMSLKTRREEEEKKGSKFTTKFYHHNHNATPGKNLTTKGFFTGDVDPNAVANSQDGYSNNSSTKKSKHKTSNSFHLNPITKKNMHLLKHKSSEKVEGVANVERDDKISDPHLSHISEESFKAPVIIRNDPFRRKKTKKDQLGRISSFIFKNKSRFFESMNYNDTKSYEFFFEQYNYNCAMQCVLSFISIVSVFIEYEISFKNNSANGLSLISSNGPYDSPRLSFYNSLDWLALWVLTITSILLWLTIVYEYFLHSRIQSYHKKLSVSIIIKSPENLKSLFMHIVIFLLHPSPAFKDMKLCIYNPKFDVNLNYLINSFLGLACLLRLVYFIKFYLVSSRYMSPRSQRICEMNNFDTSLAYGLKANMIKHPFRMYTIFFIATLVFTSFGLRTFERELDNDSKLNYASFYNVVWSIIITMTTVGYGDYYPSTIFGRIIVIFACFCGVFLISMLVVSVTNLLNFEEAENTVFLLLERISLNTDKDKLAARLISRYFRLTKILKNDNSLDFKEKERLRDNFLLNFIEFKEKCQEYNSSYPPASNYDDIFDELERMEYTLENLTQNLEDIYVDKAECDLINIY